MPGFFNEIILASRLPTVAENAACLTQHDCGINRRL
jgi:hypothetical protein